MLDVEIRTLNTFEDIVFKKWSQNKRYFLPKYHTICTSMFMHKHTHICIKNVSAKNSFRYSRTLDFREVKHQSIYCNVLSFQEYIFIFHNMKIHRKIRSLQLNRFVIEMSEVPPPAKNVFNSCKNKFSAIANAHFTENRKHTWFFIR